MAAFTGIVFLSPAYGHGDQSILQDTCTFRVGGHLVHFNAYQPGFDQHGHYCQDLPSTGDTFIVLDLPYTPARSVSSQLNIYTVSGAGEQVALASSPFALRQNGIIELRFKIDSPGNFIANIIFQGVENSSHDYPFSASLSSDTASKNTQTPSSGIYQVFTLIITLWLLYLVIIKFRKKRSQNR